MKSPAVYFLAAFLVISAAARAGDDIGDYLPQEKFEGHFMRVVYPPRATELFKKMQAAIGENREWFAAAVRNNKPGEPLPYDPRMGLTPDEYKEFVALSKQSELKEALAREIQVVSNSDHTISLDAGDGFKTLGALKFDLMQNVITTPYGDLDKPKPVDNSGKGMGGAFGPYTGIIFGMEGGEEGSTIENPSGRTVSITLGKIIATGKRFIYYNVVVIENGKRTTGIDMILEY